MRTTLELPDPLFARLKALAVSERLSLKELLRSYVEQGPNTLPRVEGPLAISGQQLSNAALFDLLTRSPDAFAPPLDGWPGDWRPGCWH